MNRLLDVSRVGGFPWCAETADALNQNARYIEAIMDGFIPASRFIGGSYSNIAVLLSGLPTSASYMYINENQAIPSGRIVKIMTKIPITSPDAPIGSRLYDNSGKYTLIDRSVKVSINKENSEEKYKDCILEELYELALSDNNNPGWRFFTVSDLFERERFKYIGISELIFNQFDVNADFGSTIRYNQLKTRLEIKLLLNHSTTNLLQAATKRIEIPVQYANEVNFPTDFEMPVTAVSNLREMGIGGDNRRVSIPAVLRRENILSNETFYIALHYEVLGVNAVIVDRTIISGSVIL